MIKRILGFKLHDWKHVGFLLRNCIRQLFKGEFNEAIDALYWIKIHLSYDSKLVLKKERNK